MEPTTSTALVRPDRPSTALLAFGLLCLSALAALTLTGPIGALALFVVVLLPLAALPSVLIVILRLLGFYRVNRAGGPDAVTVR